MSFYSIESFEDLKEKLHAVAEKGEYLIAGLEKTESFQESVKELFRIFHSLKPLAYYLNLQNLYKVTESVEDLLGALRLQKKPPRKEVIDWFYHIFDYFVQCEKAAMRDSDSFPELDGYTVNMFRTAIISSSKKVNVLEDKSVLVIHENKESASKIASAIKGAKEVHITTNAKEAAQLLKKGCVQLLILSSEFKDNALKLAHYYKSNCSAPCILIDKGLDTDAKKKFLQVGVDSIIQPSDAKAVADVAFQHAQLYFQEKTLKLTNHKVAAKVRELKPLPNTIFELQKKADDPEAGLRECATIISKDPVMTAKLLETVNMPFYGLKQQIDSINQAVTFLGKERTVSLCLQASARAVLNIDISAYGLTVEQFYEVSKLRNDIAISWFPKVNFSELPMLSTSSIIGNIGQILISKVLRMSNKDAAFKAAFAESGRLYSEIEFIGATTEDISADMLTIWGMNPKLINSIRYAFDLANCPDDTKQLALANFIIYSLVPSESPKIEQKTIKEMVEFAAEMNLKPDALQTSINKALGT